MANVGRGASQGHSRFLNISESTSVKVSDYQKHSSAMLLNRLKWVGVALLACIGGGYVLIQNRLVGDLSDDNRFLRRELQRVAVVVKENEDLSNRLVQVSVPQISMEEPVRELLRLRGEVAVLRRQLQESQSNVWSLANASEASSFEVAQKDPQALRVERQAEIVRLESLLNALPNLDGDTQTRILRMEDDGIATLQKQLASAERRLAALQNGRSPKEASLEDTLEEVADLNKEIQQRTDGVLMGLPVKLTSLKEKESAQDKDGKQPDGQLR